MMAVYGQVERHKDRLGLILSLVSLLVKKTNFRWNGQYSCCSDETIFHLSCFHYVTLLLCRSLLCCSFDTNPYYRDLNNLRKLFIVVKTFCCRLSITPYQRSQ